MGFDPHLNAQTCWPEQVSKKTHLIIICLFKFLWNPLQKNIGLWIRLPLHLKKTIYMMFSLQGLRRAISCDMGGNFSHNFLVRSAPTNDSAPFRQWIIEATSITWTSIWPTKTWELWIKYYKQWQSEFFSRLRTHLGRGGWSFLGMLVIVTSS